MRSDIDEAEGARPIGANLVTSWVLAALLIIMTTFLAQFPEVESTPQATAATR